MESYNFFTIVRLECSLHSGSEHEGPMSTAPNKSRTPQATPSSIGAGEAISLTHTEELVIALCGPIGSGHRQVSDEIKRILEDSFNYTVKIIKLSKIIEEVSGPVKYDDQFGRIMRLQDNGNSLRESNANEFLAVKAIEQISIDREEEKENSETDAFESRRVCYIIDSLKNSDEYKTFYLTYREMFYCFGVYSPQHVREKSLQDRGMTSAQVHELIDRDSGEELEHGQQVRDTFVRSDFFLRVPGNNRINISAQIERYLHLIFGTRVITPTPDETAMHHAWVAAANSACLSRQVGAALTDSEGEIISVGWNDVPKYGGGLYVSKISPNPMIVNDNRCYNSGAKCHNDEEKHLLSDNVFSVLLNAGLLSADQKFEFTKALENTKIRGLIEFSRSIHAEMHALLSAAHSEGSRIKDGNLYVTTYPCHSCARHIVASGVSKVFYIEPYRKSLAIKLHDDSVTEDESGENKVKILPFSGVSPNKYLSLFTGRANNRKTPIEGNLIEPDQRSARPILEESLEGFPTRESIAVRAQQNTDPEVGGNDAA